MLDALGPMQLRELHERVVAAEFTSPSVARSRFLRGWLPAQDHRTSSYVRRLMLDRFEADQNGEWLGLGIV